MKLKKIISTNLRAGALTYTLFVAILSSIILSAIILTGYYHKVEYSHYKLEKQNLANMSSAIAKALAVDDLSYTEVYREPIFTDGYDSMEIISSPWGAWDILKVRTFNNHGSYSKYFTKGYFRSGKAQSALYVYDEGRPVSVSGKTKITGKAYLPKAGLRSSYVGRIGYGNNKLIYGEKLDSEDKMPSVNSKRTKVLKQFASGSYQQLFDPEMVLTDKEITSNSFTTDLLVHHRYDDVHLRDSLQGFIWIHANKRIFLDSEAYLDHVILSAPIIEVDSGFTGAVQLFATDTILIGSGAKLTYPSFIGLVNEEPPATINLEPNVEVNGVIYMNGDEDWFNQRILVISDQATVKGMVYCHGMAEMTGTINGHLTTRKFLINTFSGVYENYIFNAKLNGTELGSEFATSDLWFYADHKNVLEWLD
ncbi:MAG: hypothetical protein WBA74_24065 [Cyclobacteriaceae bacterium]